MVELALVRTVEASDAAGIAGGTLEFVPYKELRWNDWMHAGDCVQKNMTARYYKDGRIEYSADARNEDTNDCWNPFKLTAYNGASAHLHTTGNHPYCMQRKSQDFPVRWTDAYPEAFFHELHQLLARGNC